MASWPRARRQSSEFWPAANRSTESTPASANWRACASRRTDLAQLQRNIVLSHAAGVGEPASVATTRLMMALKLGSLAQGASGVQPRTLQLIEAMLARGVTPVVPSQGSVGASGDLAPLAHMAAAMIGVGEARIGDRSRARCRRARRSRPRADRASAQGGARAPQRHAILDRQCAHRPVQGRDVVRLRFGDRRVVDRRRARIGHAVRRAHTCAPAPSRPDRSRRGLARAARGQRHSRLASDRRRTGPGSLLPALPAAGDGRLPRSPASSRHDPAYRGQRGLRQSAHLRRKRTKRCRAATFMPSRSPSPPTRSRSRFARSARSPSAGSRLLVDPALSGLPAFLTPKPGLNSGFMIAQVTAAALVAENKTRAYPASVDSIPTSANQEDHVSMAAHGARRLEPMAENALSIIGIELIAAAQACDFHAPLLSSAPLEALRAPAPPRGSCISRTTATFIPTSPRRPSSSATAPSSTLSATSTLPSLERPG